MGVSCTMRLFSVLLFSENLRRYNRSGPIVQILTSMRVAEILGKFLAYKNLKSLNLQMIVQQLFFQKNIYNEVIHFQVYSY